MDFTINEVPVGDRVLPPLLRDMIDTASALPDGKLVDLNRLAELVGRSIGAARSFTADSRLDPYVVRNARVDGCRKHLFGNVETCNAYREQYEDE